MSNIKRNKQLNDVHLHIDKAYKIISKHLPEIYVKKVQQNLAKKGIENITSSIIRNVKNGTSVRNDVLIALVEVAINNKKELEILKKITN